MVQQLNPDGGIPLPMDSTPEAWMTWHSLSERQQTLIVMRRKLSMTYMEIADALSLDPRVVLSEVADAYSLFSMCRKVKCRTPLSAEPPG